MANIQWYPGHMEKAKREIQRNLSSIQLVIELIDARLPHSSQNPMLEALTENKLRLLVLNKADAADPEVTKQWLAYYQSTGQEAIAINSKNPNDMKRFRSKVKQLTMPIRKQWHQKGMKQNTIRLLIMGIPNVGKSTFINQLVRRRIASVGNRPGVTKGEQWIKIDQDFELLDTPGILWPKFEDQDVASRLALMGAIKPDHYYSDDIALFTIAYLHHYYPEALSERYGLSDDDFSVSYPETLMILTERLGMKEDYERASDRLIRDIQKQKLGRLSLERPDDIEATHDSY
ncbi:MAG: ribosome biogenesis GTPase YlqF [Aerococcus sp.]|nr:ribosome biogenesis GTPase YlqF [Aerococcus sp.]